MNSRSKREEKAVKGRYPPTEQHYTDTRSLQKARWWSVPPNADEQEKANSRTLMGEIHLPGDICPGFDTRDLKLEVCHLPPDAIALFHVECPHAAYR
jgi:hypothetical protein